MGLFSISFEKQGTPCSKWCEGKMEKKKNTKKTIYTLIGIAALVAALVCVTILAVKQYRMWKAERLYDQMAEATTLPREESSSESAEQTEAETEESDPDTVAIPEKNIDFDELHATVSENIYAWIYIPNTHVDYPIFQDPVDNTYYLTHNVDGSEGYPGCIYTENYNSRDFSDPHTVIYGHNMRDTTMFSDLHLYEDQTFFDNNRYVYIYTEDGQKIAYKIFAAYQTNNSHQLLNFDFSNKQTLLEYLENTPLRMQEPCIYDDTTKFSEDDQILTLSTCVIQERQFHLRYLVQALRVK